MKQLSLLIIIAIINVLFAFLLINKQNNIIKLLYEIQQLKKTKEQFLETKKGLLVSIHKEQQLSSIQNFAQTELNMKPITLKETKTIAIAKEED